MATFLTNPKMAPALADRVEGSVRGRRSKPGDAARSARVVALVRLGVVALVISAAVFVLVARQKENKQLELQRKALLDDVQAQTASMTEQEKSAVSRDESWLLRLSAAYEGDLVDPTLRAAGALATALSRSAVYVRGPIETFTSTAAIARDASASLKDSFLLCMVDPPASRTEKALLAQVRVAYAGGPPLEQKTANVRDLQEAYVGSRVLLPSWAERARTARDEQELAKLKGEWDRAHVERARLALRAELLIAVMDERGQGTGSSELDGERAHDVRIAVVDLSAQKVLLRVRKHVDPTGWSERSRSEAASGLDGCALAVDVAEALKKSPAQSAGATQN